MEAQIKPPPARKKKRNVSLSVPGITKTPRKNARPLASECRHDARAVPFVDAVEIEWDTPALRIPPFSETIVDAAILDAAPRPMAPIDSLWRD